MHRAVFVGLVALGLVGTAVAEDKPEMVLPPKHKAYSVKIDPTAVTGFIIPGSRVDAIHTRKRDDGKTVSHVILTNVLVVAVDQVTEPGQPAKVLTQTVTLAVLQKDGFVLALADKQGKISLVLRKPEK